MSKGFTINIQNNNVMTFEQENDLYAGQSIKLQFQCGQMIFESEFKVGQDVEWAKKCVGEKLDCNRNEFDLYFEGKVMPEFYSLNDVANLQDGSKVDVKMKN